jgi:signal peptidase
MKSLKIIYYIVIAFIILIAILLIVSAFPIPGNYKVMVVQSGSMIPAIKTGSIVVVKPEKDFKIGDIITFGPYSKTKAPTTHRIYDIKVVGGEAVYITKGDANNAPDTREIKKEDIVGKVLFSVPYLGYAVDFAKKPIGFALMIIVPAAIIIYDEIRKIFGEIKKKKNA